jgi:hypothetical protein
MNFHLTGDAGDVERLFRLGVADAEAHHEELARFFGAR